MSDKQSCAFRTTIGGQALIEGILMRGPEKQAIVVRGPEGLVIKEEELRLIKDRYPILGLPLIRGSGIGLAVCDEIIRLHDGSFSIDNAEGGGCVVTITLPAA